MIKVYRLFSRFLMIILLLVFLGGHSSIVGASSTEVVVDQWEIPFLNCLTGPIASIGEYMAWSAHRAAGEINEKGGVKGKPIKIVDYDTGISPDKALEQMAKIVNKSLVALGPVPEACIMAAMPLAVRNELLCMIASTTYEYQSQFFPFAVAWDSGSDKTLPPVLAGWAKRNPDMKKVVQFLEMYGCWPGMAEAHVMGLESVGVETIEIEVPADAVTFSSIVVRALAQKPDGFVLTCTSEKAAKIIIELEKYGWEDKSKIIVFSSADDMPLYTTGKERLNGIYVYSYLDSQMETERWESFKEAYKEAHGGLDPVSLSTIYYDCVYMIKEALENTAVTGDPKKLKEERALIRDYIRNIQDFEGVQLTWSMKDGVPTDKGTFLFTIKDQAKEFVEYFKPWP